MIMRTIFAIPGFIMSFLCLVIMFLAMIPFLGWLNWINIPLAVLALLFSLIARLRTGTVICIVVILLGLFRLKMGCGVL